VSFKSPNHASCKLNSYPECHVLVSGGNQPQDLGLVAITWVPVDAPAGEGTVSMHAEAKIYPKYHLPSHSFLSTQVKSIELPSLAPL